MFSEKTDPQAEHELEVIDAVVRGGGEARPEDAALTDFALLIRNARPLPDHGAALRLDSAVAGHARRPALEPSARGPLLAGIASLAVLFVALAYASGGLTGNGDKMSGAPIGSTAPGGSGGIIQPKAAQSGAARMPAPAAADSVEGLSLQKTPPPITATAAPDRKVARTARLTLAAPSDKVERLADRVNAIADQARGYVQTSQVSTADAGHARATFLLMVPAANYQATLARLSRLAHVRSRAQGSLDITAQYKSNERSLAAAQKRVEAAEDRLAKVRGTAGETAAKLELKRAQNSRRAAAGRVRVTRTQVNYVPLDLKIVADASAADADKGTIAKAFSRAGKILTGAVAVLIVALAVLIPLAVVCAALWWGARRWRRGRAETVIGEAAAQPE